MNIFTRVIVICVILFISTSSHARQYGYGNTSLNQGSDSVRTSDGAECRSSNASDKRLEVGAYGSDARSDQSNFGNSFNNQSGSDAGLFAKFTYEFGAPNKKVNCNAMYNNELRRQELELQLLEEKLAIAKMQRNRITNLGNLR